MSNQLDAFETELLEELKAHVAKRPTRLRNRRFAMVGIAAVVGCGAVVGTVAVSTLSPSAAYAVTEDSSGDVTVTVHSLSDSTGLQAELAKHGIHATVNYNAAATAIDPMAVDGTAVTPLQAPASPPASGANTVTATSSTPGFDQTSFEKNCGISMGDLGTKPMPAVTADADQAVISIPHGSVPIGRDLQISTAGGNKEFSGITVGWNGLDGTTCGIGTASAGTTPDGK